VTFQMFESYWPTAASNPASSQDEVDFAAWIERTTKVVFSRTLAGGSLSWKASSLASGSPVEEIARLKQQPGQDILAFGGVTLSSTLVQLGLIDEYRLMVNPILLGRGKPLFREPADSQKLELQQSKTFASGVVGLHYRKR
jgi:dihydrofolate reductase